MSVNLLKPKCDLKNLFSDLKDTLASTNLVQHKTFFNNKNGTILDILPTNKPKCFQKTTICETGLSDCNKLVITIFRFTLIKLPPKTVTYRFYKLFFEKKSVHELDQKLIQGFICKTDNSYSKLTEIFQKYSYSKLTEIFQKFLEKHAATKSKTGGNQAPFINTELSKAMMNKSKLRNRHLKWPFKESHLACKKIKNECNNLLKDTFKKMLEKVLHQVNLFGIHSNVLLAVKGFFSLITSL